jgi:16S rRNA (guanine966-N2)-methyltransferase
VVADAARALRRLARDAEPPFDLVFFDPPYAATERDAILAALLASPLLHADSRVVVEGSKRHPLPAVGGARVVDERRYGETVLTWLGRGSVEGGG